MKKIILCVATTVSLSYLFAQNYTASDNGSYVKFSIKNFGLTVNGNFKGLKAKIFFNPSDLPASSVSASVDAGTVNTGTESRDRHLRKEDYLDVAKYPLISFVSSKITNADKPGILFIEGKITIKGVTKLVSFPFTAAPKTGGFLLEGEFKLNRRDFGVGGSSLVMSDNLQVFLSVLARKVD